MISKTNHQVHEMSLIILENYIPENHLLRKVDRSIDFRFIYELVEPLYARIGRPSIDPIVLFKLLFINHLYGFNSMRRTIEETKVNLAYRWFIGYGVEDAIPHFSDFSKNYTRKFSQPIEIAHPITGVVETKTVFAAVFDRILAQAFQRGYVKPAHIYVDSTHIKASANKKKATEAFVLEERKAYQDALDQECDTYSIRKGLKLAKPVHYELKRIKLSSVDPECGLFHKGQHEKQFAYSAQTTCDQNGFVLGTIVSPANLHDSQTFLPAFDEVHQVFGTMIRSVGIDAGYKSPAIAKELIERKITALVPYTRPKGAKKKSAGPEEKEVKLIFTYDVSADVYHCPQGKILTPRSVSKEDGYVTYRSRSKDCKECPLRNQCFSRSVTSRTVKRSVWQAYSDELEHIRLTSYHAQYYPLRKQTIERIFADGKEKQGLRYTRYRGRQKVQDYTYLLFASMNMKKIAIWDARKASLDCLKILLMRTLNFSTMKKGGLRVQLNF
jgi:transposase